MADDGTDVANGTQSQEETSDIPKYDLYIRVCLLLSSVILIIQLASKTYDKT